MRVLRSLLPFEVELTRLSGLDRRRLNSFQKWYYRRTLISKQQQITDKDEEQNEETGAAIHEIVRRDNEKNNDDVTYHDNSDIDANAVQKALQNYLLSYLIEELSVKKDYVKPFKVILFLPQKTRGRDRRLINYDNNSSSSIELIEDGDQLPPPKQEEELETDHISSSSSTSSVSSPSSSSSLSSQSLLSVIPSIPSTNSITKTNLRRRTNKTVHRFSYGGAVAFDLPSSDSNTDNNNNLIPPETNVQAYQLQAILDEDSVLLNLLRDSNDASSGLTTVINVNIKLINTSGGTSTPTNPINPSDPSSPASGERGFDVIIVVAIAVAACSMVLLAFALFLAFRRRKRQRNGRNKPIGSPLHERNSKKTESVNSPSTRLNGDDNTPPVLEMRMDLEHDDCISDYTESVFSVPVTNNHHHHTTIASNNNTCTNTNKNHTDKPPTPSNPSKSTTVSARFAPRYIVGEAVEERSAECDSSADVTSIGGVPPPIGSNAVRQSTKTLPTTNSKITNAKTTKKWTAGKNKETELSSSLMKDLGLGVGLYPNHDSLIDEDIATSLEAYAMGGILGGSSGSREDNDNLSLSSAETYGYSLDGMNSTVANSVRYGY